MLCSSQFHKIWSNTDRWSGIFCFVSGIHQTCNADWSHSLLLLFCVLSLSLCIVSPPVGMLIRRVVNISLGILIGYLSTPVVLNLLSSRQVMNTSFDPLRIVNTYGAFGRYRIHQDQDGPFKHFRFFFCKHFQNLSSMLVYSLRIKVHLLETVSTRDQPTLFLLLSSITKERTEVIFQGTLSQDPKDPEAIWEEYQFLCKPGDVYRRPCLISPYHYRLDWLMWFAAFQVS